MAAGVVGPRFDRTMTSDQRIWLEVSYTEQDAAKAAAAPDVFGVLPAKWWGFPCG
jgi:hypothetical protein